MPSRNTDPEVRRQRQQAKLDALHEKLTEQMAQLRSGDDWKEWLGFAARFHQYSFRNVMAIYAQRPDATLVAGYEAWKTMGRQVQRGEKGLQILAPVTRRAAPENTSPSETETAADRGESEWEPLRVAGFRATYVWDVSQTAGDSLPEPPTPELLRGRAPEGLWDGLAAQVQQAGFSVGRGDTGQSEGYTHYPSRIVRIDADAEPAQAAGTLAHELGHVLMHGHDQFENGTTAGCRGVREVEAESVAYLTTAHAGLDTSSHTFDYVTGWATGVDQDNPENVVAATGQRVMSTAHQVITRLDETATAEPEAEQKAQPAAQLGVRALTGQQAAGSVLTRAVNSSATLATPTAAPRSREESRLVAACEAAAAFQRDQLLHHPGAEHARRYLADRGLGHVLDPDSPWKVGYAPAAWRDLQNHLRGRGFSDQELAAAGLSTPARHGPIDRFRGRVVAPVRDADGATVAFIGRAVPGGLPTDGPKYLNSPATAIYDKSRVLYGLAEQREALTSGARPVVVEGYLDVLAVAAPGQHPSHVAAVATCGGSLTAGHVQALDTAARREAGVTVALDADHAGHEATLRAYDLLAPREGPLDAAQLPAGTDPADMADHPDALRTLLADPSHLQPLADVVIDDRLARWEHLPATLETSIGALRSAAPVLAELPPDQVSARVPGLADRLGLAHETVTTEVTEALTDADTLVARIAARTPRGDHHPHAAEPPRGVYSQGAEPARLAGVSFPRPTTPAADRSAAETGHARREGRGREPRNGDTELTRP